MTARTGDVIEQAMRVMDDYGNGYDGLNQFGEREALAQALSDAGLLRQEPPTRDEIARAYFARKAEIAAERLGLAEPVCWDDLDDLDHAALLSGADAVLALLGGEER